MTVEQLDHATRGVSRLLVHFQDKPNMSGLIRAVGAELNEIEQAIADLCNLTIATAEGANLDAEGTIARVLRLGRSDADYRAAIQARLVVLRGNAKIEDLLFALGAALNGQSIEITEPFIRTVYAEITQAIGGANDPSAPQLAEILDAAVPGGVRHFVFYGLVDVAERFTLAPADAIVTDTNLGCAGTAQTTGGRLSGVIQ